MDVVKSMGVLTPDNLLFVVSTTSGSSMGVDPSSQFSLLKFEGKKNKRQSLSADYGGMMKKGKTHEGENEISLNLKKIREGIVGLVPGKPLDKGEYAFINKMSVQGGGISMKWKLLHLV